MFDVSLLNSYVLAIVCATALVVIVGVVRYCLGLRKSVQAPIRRRSEQPNPWGDGSPRG